MPREYSLSELGNEIKKYTKSANVTLKSGKKSTYYVDMKSLYGDPDIRRSFAVHLFLHTGMDKENITCVAGSGNGGIPLATEMSSIYGLKLANPVDVPKDHGLRKEIEYYEPNENDNVLLVDDILTEGTSARNSIRKIRKTGARIVSHSVIVNRNEDGIKDIDGVTLNQLFNIDEITKTPDVPKF